MQHHVSLEGSVSFVIAAPVFENGIDRIDRLAVDENLIGIKAVGDTAPVLDAIAQR